MEIKNIEISEIMSACIKHGFKAYPMFRTETNVYGHEWHKWYIQIVKDGHVHPPFPKELKTKKQINDAIEKTWRHYYNKFYKPVGEVVSISGSTSSTDEETALEIDLFFKEIRKRVAKKNMEPPHSSSEDDGIHALE